MSTKASRAAAAAYMREWNKKNSARLSVLRKKRRATDKNYAEKDRARSRAYGKTHRKEILDRATKWQRDNRDHRKVYLAAYHAKDPTKAIERAAAWKAANPARAKANSIHYFHRRRARMKTTKAESLECQRFILWHKRRKTHRCHHCRESFIEVIHFDHFIPLSKGGRHVRSNLVVSCPTCNMRKSAKLLT